MKIKKITAREILDSRGIPTIEAGIIFENGQCVSASVPSGTSAGVHEAVEIRDHDKARFDGEGVTKAVENVETIIGPALVGFDVRSQQDLDKKLISLDGTKNKSNLGENAILAVSLAAIKSNAVIAGKPLYDTIASVFDLQKPRLPRPFSVVIEGGKHADTKVDFQEFMIVVSDDNTEENLRKITEIYHELATVLVENGKNTNVGFEGAFGPQLDSNREGLDLIMEAISRAGLEAGKDVNICLDVAASELYDKENKKYVLKSENIALSSHQMAAFLEELTSNYPIISIEDGLSEDDWEGWAYLYDKIGEKVLLVGDDLFVTNVERIKEGMKRKAANAVLIKPNQIGTVSETVEAIKTAYSAGWEAIVSHRSGETNETFIIDLAVAAGCIYCKIGAPSRGERVAKFNRLSEIGESFLNN